MCRWIIEIALNSLIKKEKQMSCQYPNFFAIWLMRVRLSVDVCSQMLFQWRQWLSLISCCSTDVVTSCCSSHVIKWHVSSEVMKHLVAAVILSRLDYCNSVLAGLPWSTVAPLHRVQNAAARLVLGWSPRDHVSSAFVELHWLPIQIGTIDAHGT